MTGGGRLQIDVPVVDGLRPGDEVVVAMPGQTFLSAAALAYLLPPAALALAAGLGAVLGLPDVAVAALCLPVLGLSFLPLIRAERSGRMSGEVRIERVLPRAPDGQDA